MRKTVTVVFSDVIDSTPLGEALDAESYRRMLSRYFIEVSRVLEHHGGTVEKFIGDAVMAVFGIPVVHEDDALRAVRAVTELREALHALNEDLRAEFGMELRVRTGINTGEVVAGDPAEGQAFATGSAVATAQRLEAAASPGEILIGDSTYRLVREAVLVEPLEPLELKGKSQPVRAWRLLGVLTGAPAFARRLDSPMVGREHELDRLRAAFEEAARKRECRVISVIGTAGIGKSRLVKELLSSVDDEASVLTGRCLPYGKGITYWPLRDLVRRAAGEVSREAIERLLEGEPDAHKVAARIAGAIGIAGSKSAPEETMWAVRRLLEHLAREVPLVIAFDDLQWAEPTLLDLIEYLLGWIRDAPILIVCMARPDLLELHPGWLGAATSASSIVLDPLSEPEAEVLLELLSGETELAADLFAQITEAAEGNPLYVEQMLAMLTENGSASHDLAIPPTIHALLAARLDRLEPEERAVIERAAVIGKEFWRSAIAELTPEEERESSAPRLMALARKEFIEPGASIFPEEDGFRFRHILIRDAAYLGIPKETRAQLHERFAAWLERTAGERASELDEIIGYHLEQAHGYRAELGPSGPGSADLATRAGERLAAAGRRAIVDRGDASAACDAHLSRRRAPPSGLSGPPRAPHRARQSPHARRRLRTRRRCSDRGSGGRRCDQRPGTRAAHDDRARVLPELHEPRGLGARRLSRGRSDHSRARGARRRRRARQSVVAEERGGRQRVPLGRTSRRSRTGARARPSLGSGRGGRGHHRPARPGPVLRSHSRRRGSRDVRAVSGGERGEPNSRGFRDRRSGRPQRDARRLRPGAQPAGQGPRDLRGARLAVPAVRDLLTAQRRYRAARGTAG